MAVRVGGHGGSSSGGKHDAMAGNVVMVAAPSFVVVGCRAADDAEERRAFLCHGVVCSTAVEHCTWLCTRPFEWLGNADPSISREAVGGH
eukprot:CAMPEP_0202872970 /NCGR_PEP_ID=MMETSP1391-20130828/22366_1 /ASSEMBLY_ACC=CAM_ASM_000867 /TAXON_ID=1034604 /ORGANISM="Chlamydomonas leiostraca, Strain SAG 11-49" /LENGTH=89 /DNA_ID=CAMNT_0049554121 /DNA_START=81 /DNA_END=350 /DNA_ORIENTATION=+